MWISRGEYRRLLRALARSERRADALQVSLEVERSENRRAERHWANSMLRARQIGAFPLQPVQQLPSGRADINSQFEEVAYIDPGELEAVIAEGIAHGFTAKEAENMLRKDRGLPLLS